ncbi:hypothetical protein BR63_17115 [Thermanaerosceptrum fracticalcis]|uniref:Uncharacterized protein n=2 Tax=Thermanaerosceptrum fracticalcis TaxID=1712410 RepID=A0A7G6E6X4_THEFR|nr:hypothetical protein BR63_17115 [Thermanaerosceptrum fracticalcis]
MGNEDEFVECEAARKRVLALCYNIRHALMGDREIEFIDNGMDEEKKRRLSILAPDKNVYLKIYVLWSEMLFITIALNEFLELYNSSIAQVRMLQAAVAGCLKQTVSENVYARMLNIMNGRYVYVNGYIAQYLDILNNQFLKMKKENRVKNLSNIAKRIAERGREYREL